MGRKAQPCDFCDGMLSPRVVTVDWRRNGQLVVIENVPALVCNHCGERYYAQAVMRQMDEIGRSKRPGKRTIKVPVARFETVA
jgi:YgiT-type zinc finger domain-containing protein